MPFRERTRNYWIEVGEGQCQYEYYDERRGWQKCKMRAKHVHHILPESEVLAKGGNPERGVGLPLCEQHHVRNDGTTIFEEKSSFHPDVSHAYRKYRDWKIQESHMREIGGKRRTVDYSTSPFADIAREHQEKVRRGERVSNGDDATDRYYIEQMEQRAQQYYLATGKRAPQTAPHPRTDPSKKKHWWDKFFGGDDE